MRCAYDGIRSSSLSLQELGCTHIDQLHVALVVHHYIFRFDVAIDDRMRVKVLHAQYQRSDIELAIIGVQ